MPLATPEFDVDGVSYRLRSLNAVEEWRFYTLLVPALPMLSSMEVGFRSLPAKEGDRLAALLPLAELPDDALTKLSAACRSACERDVDGAWVAVDVAMPMTSLVSLLMAVSTGVLGEFFAFDKTAFRPATRDGADYDPIAMANGEDWLWRPVLRGMCRAESMYDGTLHLAHIAKLNDALAVADENEYRARKAAERDAERRNRR